MKLSSVVKKAFNYLDQLYLQRHAVNGSMIYLGQEVSSLKPKQILFYFPDYEFMHFGDHLFFEPLARFLRMAGFEVVIRPTKVMKFYFQANDYAIGSEADLATADLVISRPEFHARLKKSSASNVLYIDTASYRIKDYLCRDMITKVGRLLGSDSQAASACPAPLPLESKPSTINLAPGINYLLFNNYIDSGFHRVRRWHYDKIARFTEQKAKELGLKVIHLGTEKERLKDTRKYDFVSLDLRGKTSPADLFYLAAHQAIKANVSFDTFPLHLCFIYGKKSYVLLRKRFSRSGNQFVANYVLPPFPPPGKRSDLIEYI